MYEITDIVVKELARQGYSNTPELQFTVTEDPELRMGDWEFYTFATNAHGGFTDATYSEDGSNYDLLAYKSDGVLAHFGYAHEKDQKLSHHQGMGALSALNCVTHDIDQEMSDVLGRLVVSHRHQPDCVGITNMWSSNSSSVNDILGTELAEGAYRIGDGPYTSLFHTAYHVKVLNTLLEQQNSPFRLVKVQYRHGTYWTPLLIEELADPGETVYGGGGLAHIVMKLGINAGTSGNDTNCAMPVEACFKMGHYQPVEEVREDAKVLTG
jgi:hypothetical protein